MRRVILDFKDVSLRYELHLLLKSALGLPDYYGKNLDALYDCLTDIREDTEIELRNTESLHEALGGYAKTALRVLKDAADENGHITIK